MDLVAKRRLLFTPFFILGAVFAIACALLSTGCGKKEEASSSNFSSLYSGVFAAKCVRCHQPGGSGTVGGSSLDFSTQAVAYTTLASSMVTGSQSAGTCGSVRVVSAGAPGSSYVVGILNPIYRNQNNFGATGCVPITNHYDVYATGDDVTNITNWISNGAQNN